MKKQSQLSTARARAKNPLINEEMFRRINAVYAQHYAEGILKNPEPEVHQIYGGDEIGVNPHGHNLRETCLLFLLQETDSGGCGWGGW